MRSDSGMKHETRIISGMRLPDMIPRKGRWPLACSIMSFTFAWELTIPPPIESRIASIQAPFLRSGSSEHLVLSNTVTRTLKSPSFKSLLIAQFLVSMCISSLNYYRLDSYEPNINYNIFSIKSQFEQRIVNITIEK